MTAVSTAPMRSQSQARCLDKRGDMRRASMRFQVELPEVPVIAHARADPNRRLGVKLCRTGAGISVDTDDSQQIWNHDTPVAEHRRGGRRSALKLQSGDQVTGINNRHTCDGMLNEVVQNTSPTGVRRMSLTVERQLSDTLMSPAALRMVAAAVLDEKVAERPDSASSSRSTSACSSASSSRRSSFAQSDTSTPCIMVPGAQGAPIATRRFSLNDIMCAKAVASRTTRRRSSAAALTISTDDADEMASGLSNVTTPRLSEAGAGVASSCGTVENLVDAKSLARQMRRQSDPFASKTGLDLTSSLPGSRSSSKPTNRCSLQEFAESNPESIRPRRMSLVEQSFLGQGTRNSASVGSSHTRSSTSVGLASNKQQNSSSSSSSSSHLRRRSASVTSAGQLVTMPREASKYLEMKMAMRSASTSALRK